MWLKRYNHEILLIILLTIGIILRFYHFFQLPFMWDEMSAWSRLQFNSFSDLIEFGIKPDGHPAGVQVFLYYWTLLFGDQEWVVKLPFNILGVASIYIFYRIGKIWWSSEAGLISASFMASLQFFVLYSTIARPYISGLFLTLMMVYFWSLFFFQAQKKKYLVGFIIFASLSSYNHHFSLLFATIVGLSGLLFVKKKNLVTYIISGIIIFVLYIPHLPIFFHQLGIGGIGGEGNWLSKPRPNFAVQFLRWVFHDSYYVFGMTFLLTATSIILSLKNEFFSINIKKRIILFFWFILPLAIGYYYSVIINPVIQYSMLIFSFPYILLLLFSGFKKLKPYIIYTIIFVIIIVNISTLVYSRKHYEIIFKQPFDGTAQSLVNEPKETFLLYNTIPSYQQYYLKKYGLNDVSSFSIYNQNLSLQEIDSILSTIKQTQILCSGLPEDMVQVVQHHFPFLQKREDGYTYESYLFSKKEGANKPFHKLVTSLDLLNPKKGWNIDENRILLDSNARPYYQFLPHQEWGFTYSDSLHHLLQNTKAIIDMETEIISQESVNKSTWSISIKAKDQVPFWRGKSFEKNLIKSDSSQRLYMSLDSYLISEKESQDAVFTTYFWNKNKNNFRVKSVKIYLRKGNSIKYGLFDLN